MTTLARMMNDFLTNGTSSSRTELFKKQIIHYFVYNGDATIADLCKETALSIPTVTKFLGELIADGYVIEYGKLDTGGGRKPSTYCLNPTSGYFVGVDVWRSAVNVGAIDFKGNRVMMEEGIPYALENTPEALEALCAIIEDFLDQMPCERSKVLAIGVNLGGRVNPRTGYSHTHFLFEERSLVQVLEERFGITFFLENDTRAMAYGEYVDGVGKGEKNVLFFNLGWGLGMGMILGGKLYYGRSGFSGEVGHFCLSHNEILCHCGKKGCLETEVSGSAFHRKLKEKLDAGQRSLLSSVYEQEGDFTFAQMLEALGKEDVLCIEILEEMATTLGQALAGIINVFNPELVIIGGSLAVAGDYLALPLRAATRKYSLNLVNQDTTIKFSKLRNQAGVIGACHLSRNKILGTMDYDG